jgi:predicted regulator of Ras-like GTPase activity (Roadblock/LC7/MglB family)
VRLRRFCDDFLVRDGVLAVRNLEKALEVDPVHGQALKLLGRLYLQMGAFSRAQHYLSLFVENHPPDEGIASLLELARERIAEDQDELLEDLLGDLVARRWFKVDIGDLAIELAPVSVEFKIASARADVETLGNSVNQLGDLEGFQAAFIYDEEGAHLVRSEKPDLEEEKVAGALSQILENSRDACQRMDVGRFSKGMMTGPAGTITLVCFENVALAVLWDDTVRTADVEPELDRLIEHVLGSSIREGG